MTFPSTSLLSTCVNPKANSPAQPLTTQSTPSSASSKTSSPSQSAEALLEGLRSIDRPVRHQHLFEDAKAMTLEFFPHWAPEDLILYQCKDGITNKLVRVTHEPSGEILLIRAYGHKSEAIIDRHQEMINMISASLEGLCPPLYGRFINGLVYGYIQGTPFSVEDMRLPHQGLKVADNLARWHRISIPGPRKAKLFPTLFKWADNVPSSYPDLAKQAVFAESIDMPKLIRELKELQVDLETFASPVVFCHNDLLSGNLIDQGSKVSFIDYEYGGYNYRGFDIANHFAEWAGFECDYSHCPSKETQFTWLRRYLACSRQLQLAGPDPSSPAIEVDDADVHSLYREVSHFTLASHLYWGLWALIQAGLSDIDFDYMSYAVLRFNQYFLEKDKLLAL